MKRLIPAVLRWGAAALLIALLCVFGAKNRVSTAPFDDVKRAVTEAAGWTDKINADANEARRFYGVEPEDYEDFVLFLPPSNMDAEELLLVRLKDPADAEALAAAAEKRIETQKKSFDGYGVEQYALLTDHAVVEVRGNYLLFVVHPQSDAVRRAFVEAL